MRLELDNSPKLERGVLLRNFISHFFIPSYIEARTINKPPLDCWIAEQKNIHHIGSDDDFDEKLASFYRLKMIGYFHIFKRDTTKPPEGKFCPFFVDCEGRLILDDSSNIDPKDPAIELYQRLWIACQNPISPERLFKLAEDCFKELKNLTPRTF